MEAFYLHTFSSCALVRIACHQWERCALWFVQASVNYYVIAESTLELICISWLESVCILITLCGLFVCDVIPRYIFTV